MNKYRAIAEEFSEQMINLTENFEKTMKQQIEDLRREAVDKGTMNERELTQLDSALVRSGIAELFGITVDKEGLDIPADRDIFGDAAETEDSEAWQKSQVTGPAIVRSEEHDVGWPGWLGTHDIYRDE